MSDKGAKVNVCIWDCHIHVHVHVHDSVVWCFDVHVPYLVSFVLSTVVHVHVGSY